MTRQNERVFLLPSVLTVNMVQELKKQILEFIQESDTDLKCAGNDVREVDASGIQVLLALYKTALQIDRKLSIVNPSQELMMAFAHSGIDKVLSVEADD